MKKYNFRLVCLWLLGVGLTSSCSQGNVRESRVNTLPYYQEATFTPYWLEDEETLPSDFHRITPFELFNQDGEVVTEKTFQGKIYVADFFFTSCPGICPKMTSSMATLQKAFLSDNQVLFLSHSVTPEKDTIPVLKKYADEKGVVSGKWHLVTGNRDLIYQLGRKAYFVEEDLGLKKSNDEFLHTENFVLVDGNRHIRGIYNGLNKTVMQQLVADIKTLKKEL